MMKKNHFPPTLIKRESYNGNELIIEVVRTYIPYEFNVHATGGSFNVVLGHYIWGKYICIPNWNVGCDISTLADSFWNRNRLEEAGLSKNNATSITEALEKISEFMTL